MRMILKRKLFHIGLCELDASVWLAQLVKSLAASWAHIRACAGGPGFKPNWTDKLDSVYHHFGVGEMSSN